MSVFRNVFISIDWIHSTSKYTWNIFVLLKPHIVKLSLHKLHSGIARLSKRFVCAQKEKSRPNKLVRKAASVVGARLDSLEEVAERRMRSKISAILGNASHPLYEVVNGLRSSFSGRLALPRCSTERFRRSFIPAAIRLYNSNAGRGAPPSLLDLWPMILRPMMASSIYSLNWMIWTRIQHGLDLFYFIYLSPKYKYIFSYLFYCIL